MEFFFYGGKLLVLDLAYYRWLKPKNDAIFEAAKALKLKELFDAHSNSMKYVLVCMYKYQSGFSFSNFFNLYGSPKKLSKLSGTCSLIQCIYFIHTISSVFCDTKVYRR